MSGMRENLSKAVVLASVSAAHSQGRECRIVSFSSESNAVEISNVTCDANGIRRLLAFLSYSFGGGTDATGALNHAVSVLLVLRVSSDRTHHLTQLCRIFADNKDGSTGERFGVV